MRRVKSPMAASWRPVLVLLCAVANIGWLGAERDSASEGNHLYDAGRYDEAESAYGEGLVDYPESERLRFNLGTAQYRQENLTDAITTLEKLLPDVTAETSGGAPPSETSELAADAAYNVGNARYRLGKNVEEQSPQEAITLYEQALLAYKWAMALDPDDEAPKFNHEFVERHAAALREKLEEQQEQQDQQEQQQEQPGEGEEGESGGEQAPQPDREGEEEQETQEQEQGAEDQAEPEQQQEEQAQQDAGGEHEESQDRQPEDGTQEQAGAAGETGAEPRSNEMTAAEARTLVDAARGEEVDPAEIRRQVGVAGVGEPMEDW